MALQIGDRAPLFTLYNDQGEKTALKDFKGKKLVLYFYPKDMTPGCTSQAEDFRDNLSKFKRKKCQVIGISKDSIERHEKFRDKHSLNFPLLADVEGKVCEKYGVWQEKKLYGKVFMGIVRTTYIISETGRISHVFEKVKVKGHVEAVLQEV